MQVAKGILFFFLHHCGSLTVVFGLWVESCGLSVVWMRKKFGLLESSVFEILRECSESPVCDFSLLASISAK